VLSLNLRLRCAKEVLMADLYLQVWRAGQAQRGLCSSCNELIAPTLPTGRRWQKHSTCRKHRLYYRQKQRERRLALGAVRRKEEVSHAGR